MEILVQTSRSMYPPERIFVDCEEVDIKQRHDTEKALDLSLKTLQASPDFASPTNLCYNAASMKTPLFSSSPPLTTTASSPFDYSHVKSVPSFVGTLPSADAYEAADGWKVDPDLTFPEHHDTCKNNENLALTPCEATDLKLSQSNEKKSITSQNGTNSFSHLFHKDQMPVTDGKVIPTTPSATACDTLDKDVVSSHVKSTCKKENDDTLQSEGDSTCANLPIESKTVELSEGLVKDTTCNEELSKECTNVVQPINQKHLEAEEMKRLQLALPELNYALNLHCKVGEGTFSSVYMASLRYNPACLYAVKHLTPTCHPMRIRKELQYLQLLGGTDNVCGIYHCMRNKDCIAFIMPYQQHSKFSDYVLDMDAEETRLYLRNLLIALRQVHSYGVIHRDVKPGNFLYDRDNKKFLLVDFGLAQSVDSVGECTAKPNRACKFPSAEVTQNTQNNKTTEVKTLPELKPISKSKVTVLSITPLLDSKKRKHTDENQEMPKTCGGSAKRPVLQSKSLNQSNIMPPKNNDSITPDTKSLKAQFQLLAPPSPGPTPISPQDTSFVRVQNSRVKLFSAPLSPSNKPKCPCRNKLQCCSVCMKKKSLVAPRAGTPGFRPPEVLLKSLHQSTAVDMWAAGVLLLSILSGCYPFFRSPDDMTALAELMSLLGTKAIKDVAARLDRMLVCDSERSPLDLRKLCVKLRASRKSAQTNKNSPTAAASEPGGTAPCSVCGPSFAGTNSTCLCPSPNSSAKFASQFPEEAYDLLYKLLDPNPDTRISAVNALNHPFLRDTN